MTRPVVEDSFLRQQVYQGWNGSQLQRRLIRPRTLIVVFDGMGSVPTTGIKGETTIHFDCEIAGWALLADQAGDVEIDIWRTDFANYPPTSADTITGATLPTLSGVDKNDSSNVSDWKQTVNDGDTFKFNINSIATVTRVTLTLKLRA